MNSDVLPDVLTAKEVAALLRIHVDSIYDLVNREAIPYQRVGTRSLRFSKAAVMAWLADNK